MDQLQPEHSLAIIVEFGVIVYPSRIGKCISYTYS